MYAKTHTVEDGRQVKPDGIDWLRDVFSEEKTIVHWNQGTSLRPLLRAMRCDCRLWIEDMIRLSVPAVQCHGTSMFYISLSILL